MDTERKEEEVKWDWTNVVEGHEKNSNSQNKHHMRSVTQQNRLNSDKNKKLTVFSKMVLSTF